MRALLVIACSLFISPAYAGMFGDANPRCVVAGCSSQLCVDADAGEMMSTCEWRAEYACYSEHGSCEVQSDNTCGWTQSNALTQCIATAAQEGGQIQ